jgi:hypothetical protein
MAASETDVENAVATTQQSHLAPEWATQYWDVVLDLHVHAGLGLLFTKQMCRPRHIPVPSAADRDAACREIAERIDGDLRDVDIDPMPITNPARLRPLCRIVCESLVGVAAWQDAAASVPDAVRRLAEYDLRPLCRELWTLLRHMPAGGRKPPMPSGAISAADLIPHVDAIIEWCGLQQPVRKGTASSSKQTGGKKDETEPETEHRIRTDRNSVDQSERLIALMGATEIKVCQIAGSRREVKERMRLIIALDQRYRGKNSIEWKTILGCSDAMVRKAWKKSPGLRCEVPR